jgi:hypothetical protein
MYISENLNRLLNMINSDGNMTPVNSCERNRQALKFLNLPREFLKCHGFL